MAGAVLNGVFDGAGTFATGAGSFIIGTLATGAGLLIASLQGIDVGGAGAAARSPYTNSTMAETIRGGTRRRSLRAVAVMVTSNGTRLPPLLRRPELRANLGLGVHPARLDVLVGRLDPFPDVGLRQPEEGLLERLPLVHADQNRRRLAISGDGYLLAG